MQRDHTKSSSPIVVVDYDPAWPGLFAEVRDALWPQVEDIALACEHVGSTSVPGLAAKPIIDMDIIVPHTSALLEVIERLAPLGYTHRGELGVNGRHAFFHPPKPPAHHLYVCLAASLGLRNHLMLRDYLRSHPQAASEYAALKRGLAAKHAHDIEAYVEGKTGFIVGIFEALQMGSEDRMEISGANQAPRDPG